MPLIAAAHVEVESADSGRGHVGKRKPLAAQFPARANCRGIRYEAVAQAGGILGEAPDRGSHDSFCFGRQTVI